MINVFAQTKIGGRETNQDRYACFRVGGLGSPRTEDVCIIIVSDGMGGHYSGDLYAECAVRHVFSALAQVIAQADMDSARTQEPFADIFRRQLEGQKDDLLNSANRALVEEADRKDLGLGGATVSVCVICGNTVYCVNAGDSPIFLYNEYENTAEEISLRDNEAETLVREGRIQRGSDEYYEGSSKLLSFLGKRETYTAAGEVESHFSSRTLKAGDVILIGSDGAFGQEILSAESLADFLRGIPGVRYYCDRLMEKAAYSTGDNQTLAVIRYISDAKDDAPQPAENRLPDKTEDVQTARRRWFDFGRK